MVAGDRQHRRNLGEPLEDVVEEANGVFGGNAAVVDITGDDNGVRLLVGGDPNKTLERMHLRVEQVEAGEDAAEVPVGGVQKSHAEQSTAREAPSLMNVSGALVSLTSQLPAYGDGISQAVWSETPLSSTRSVVAPTPNIPSISSSLGRIFCTPASRSR